MSKSIPIPNTIGNSAHYVDVQCLSCSAALAYATDIFRFNRGGIWLKTRPDTLVIDTSVRPESNNSRTYQTVTCQQCSTDVGDFQDGADIRRDLPEGGIKLNYWPTKKHSYQQITKYRQVTKLVLPANSVDTTIQQALGRHEYMRDNQ